MPISTLRLQQIERELPMSEFEGHTDRMWSRRRRIWEFGIAHPIRHAPRQAALGPLQGKVKAGREAATGFLPL
jgi:hypothetical protein